MDYPQSTSSKEVGETKKKIKPEDRLRKMLDFSVCTTPAQVGEHAHKLATEILSCWYIFSFGQVRKILDIEFYLHIPKVYENKHFKRDNIAQTQGLFSISKKPLEGLKITCGNPAAEIDGIILLHHVDGLGHQKAADLALKTMIRGDGVFQQGDGHGWKPHEEHYLKQLHRSSIFHGKTRMTFIGKDDQAINQHDDKSQSNISCLPLRFYL